MKEPTIVVDGEIVNSKPDLKGKTREVYIYLLNKKGTHGIRKIQRDLNYSSPSVVSYHTSILLDLSLINKTDDGQYFVALQDEKSVVLSSHFKFISYWIPKSVSYAITLSFILLGSIFMTLTGYNDIRGWALLTIPTISLLIILLIYDSYKISKNYIEKNM